MQLTHIVETMPQDNVFHLTEAHWDKDRTLKCICRTIPWWQAGPDTAEKEIEIVLKGVRETGLVLGVEQDGNTLEVLQESPLLWDYGSTSTIYGNAPLPDPPRFFFEFCQLVKFSLGIDRDPVAYLNWKNDFSEWLEFVFSRSYCLLSAPDPVVEATRSLLDVQAAEYAVLSDPAKERVLEDVSSLKVVKIGPSWIICSEASVSLPG